MSAQVVRALDKVTPAQWQGLAADMASGYARVTQAGTGPLPVEGTSLTAAEFADGFNGHFWVTASYADFLDKVFAKAIGAAENYCISIGTGFVYGSIEVTDGLSLVAVVALVALVKHDCQSVGNALTSWANGWGWSNSHGVWAALYIWPTKLQIGRW